MDGLEIFAILIISIIVIMIFQGTLGESSYVVKRGGHRHHRHSHHPYHPHKRHPHHRHHRHHRVYEGFSNDNLFKNENDVDLKNYGVYDENSLHSEYASEIFSEF